MRGNVYPFLPLSEAEAVRAFELQLQERADAYEPRPSASTGRPSTWKHSLPNVLVLQRRPRLRSLRWRRGGPRHHRCASEWNR